MPDDVYTHGHDPAVLRSHTWRTVENSAPHLVEVLRPGLDVLDVGCGPGTISADLARRVAPGAVLAIDRSDEVVALAREAHDEPGLEFAVGDVYRLDLGDERFDVVHAHQVLQHLSDPVAALVEMRRVCRPGGAVAVRDADYGAFSWSPDDPGLDRWMDVYCRAARANGGEPDAGRHLEGWVHDAGFSSVEVSTSTWEFTSDGDRRWWGEMWADRMTGSAVAEQVIESGLAERAELDEIASAWRRWSATEGASFTVPHGEVVARP